MFVVLIVHVDNIIMQDSCKCLYVGTRFKTAAIFG